MLETWLSNERLVRWIDVTNPGRSSRSPYQLFVVVLKKQFL